MSTTVVLCDSYFMPVREIGVEHAVYLLFSGKAEPVYGSEGLTTVASLGLAPTAIGNWSDKFKALIVDGKFLVPAVIRLFKAVAFRIANLRPTRSMILRRDKHVCQYCGSNTHLTLDHVVPQSRGGENSWENLVTACGPCNQRKANRTPDEANMPLSSRPKKVTANAVDLMDRLTAYIA
jgi:hypothetical protein